MGDTTTLTAKVSPSDAAIQSCTWDSSNTSVATVDRTTGLVTAVGAGTTQITVTADDGGYIDYITITVKSDGKEPTGISLNTLAKVEAGDPGVAIGNVAAIMQAIGLGVPMADIASPADDTSGLRLESERLPKRARAPRRLI